MSKPGLSFGLNLTKKTGPSKPAPPKRKPMFGGDDSSDEDTKDTGSKPQATEISELDDSSTASKPSPLQASKKAPLKSKNGAPPSQPPTGKNKKPQISMYGDLSSALESRKHREAAEELDPSIFDYDAVYDSLKSEKNKPASAEDAERRPKYMKSLIASAAVRRRDALIAEEKKIAREREEEGEEYADKEKFVTEAYKKQQEENRRIEEEERRREEEEAQKNKGGGMTAFYKDLLERGEQRHAEVVKAAEERAKAGPREEDDTQEEAKEKTEADFAREINEKGGHIAINEEGQVVDKRELLKGGLNLGAKKKPEPRKDAAQEADRRDGRDQARGFAGSGGGKQAMRERQSRMLESQLEQALKRSLEEEEEERKKVERASKSRKTETEISSARERYLARKREAEEAKKKGLAEKP
ncbi:coiled-coil domain-containing protein 55-domain containing protein [Biscogniauxia mediterranea]|nr:coiled-coil domain-containing protein 55-domain containing protein [Biscogniauxia mediterranea]